MAGVIDLSPLLGSEDGPAAQALSFRVFPKTGEERWMLETTQRRPWYLKTWPRANLRAQVIYRVAWVMGMLGLHLPYRKERFQVNSGSVYAQLRERFDRLGIFLGTPGPNRKIVVYASRPGRSVFVKIPLGPTSNDLVAREAVALEELHQDRDLAPLVPQAGRVFGHLAIEDIETNGTKYMALDSAELLRIHDLMERRSACTRLLTALRQDWEKQAPEQAVVAHDADTAAAIAAARAAANDFLDRLPQDMAVPCYTAHGDFTRWNVLRAADGTPRIIDWELYGLKPRWFDLVHYIVSHDLLVKRASALEVLGHLREVSQSTKIASSEVGWWKQVGFYFVYQSLYYCGIYERQVQLHAQAIWQLETWAGILRILLANSDSALEAS